MNKYQKWIDKHSRLLGNPDAALDTEGRIGIQAGLNLLKGRAEYRDFVASADRYPQRDKIETLFGLMKQAAQFEEIAIRNAAERANEKQETGTHTQERVKEKAEKVTRTKERVKDKPKLQATSEREANIAVSESTYSIRQVQQATRHLDQVLHLLPPELQQRAATIRQEYVELAELHRDARNRADSGDKAYLKKLAESICHREDYIRNFWDQVNVHLKLAANVDVSPEEQQQLLEQAAKLERKEERKDGEYTYDELQAMMQQATTDDERKHVEYLITMRKENLKKYIRRNISKTPTFYANVRLKIKELKQFGDPLSPKVIAVGKEAGMTDEELRLKV